MAAEMRTSIDDEVSATSYCLQKFRLYETHSNFYIIGRDKNRTFWRVLKIDRSEPSELIILEDTTTYTEYECCELLKWIDEGNVSTGGLKFVTTCYGIIGFIKFLGPYYILIITQRRKIGAIRGHPIYSVAKTEMIQIPNCPMQSNMGLSKNENRYKKLLNTVDLTKDFFFSYSYNMMCSLQRTFHNSESGSILYETMFVWNEYLTRGIRKNLKNTMWTVALVYGFFKQVKLSVSGREFRLTLIARRSRHYAGTRYLKRGINEKGRVANDVETEQIVFEDLPEGCPMEITSVVQNRGSIPLFWSQETSKLNIKPDITLSRKDPNYEATRLHFENLSLRYGNPIIILNLIKTYERKPRESILRAEFANAIRFINKSLPEENRLRFLHWDLHKQFRNKNANVLALLIKVGVYALNFTGLFYCQFPANPKIEGSSISYDVETIDSGDCSSQHCSNNSDDGDSLENEVVSSSCSPKIKSPMFQKGVLRTNCIDCLDRTNVAQYAYGLVALGRQLHALGILESEEIDIDNPLAEDLMSIYETMGDILALQYGGSAAHNKIFSERRGQWKAATQSQEFFRTLQRYYSNAYIDAEKQDAINLFLGYFQPQQGKPALWELGSDQHHNVGRRLLGHSEESERSFVKRSFSDGNIMSASETTMTTKTLVPKPPLPSTAPRGTPGLSDSTPELVPENEIYNYRCNTPIGPGEIITDVQEDEQSSKSDHFCYDVHGEACNCLSNFVDFEWLSSSGNSCDDIYERSSIICMTPDGINRLKGELSRSSSRSESSMKFPEDPLSAYSEHFLHWVNNDTMLFR